jgi:DNA segregation ATPase FtsK/SpoIIIE-like protein
MHFSHPEYCRVVIFDPKAAAFKDLQEVATVVSSHEGIAASLQVLVTELNKRIEFTSKLANPADAKECNAEAYKRRSKSLLMPYICVFFDEFADFIVFCKTKKDTQSLDAIARLASMGLGLGINLTFLTQAPYAEVIKGLIKNNLPFHVAFGLGEWAQEYIILGKKSKADSDDLDAPKLNTGEFLIIEQGKRVKHNAFLIGASAVKNAARNLKAGGFNFSLL